MGWSAPEEGALAPLPADTRALEAKLVTDHTPQLLGAHRGETPCSGDCLVQAPQIQQLACKWHNPVPGLTTGLAVQSLGL